MEKILRILKNNPITVCGLLLVIVLLVFVFKMFSGLLPLAIGFGMGYYARSHKDKHSEDI